MKEQKLLLQLQDLKYKVNDIAFILGIRNKTVINYLKISLEDKEKSIRKIAEDISLDRKTVKKYLESDGEWHHESTGGKRENKRDNYKNLVKRMHIEGSSSKQIYIQIKEQGYFGSDYIVRKFITNIRTEALAGEEAVDIKYIKRNDLISLLYKPIEKIKTITSEELEIVLTMLLLMNIVTDYLKGK